jgi:hypothetical protein
VDSCYLTTGLTQIGSASCVGTAACAGLAYGTIMESSCVGVGSCSKPLSRDVGFCFAYPDLCCYLFPEYPTCTSSAASSITSSAAPSVTPPTSFTVGSNSCLGCYSCVNSTASKFFIEYAAWVSYIMYL